MATLPVLKRIDQYGRAATPPVNLCTVLGGNVDTTNILDRGDLVGPGAVVVTSAVGATPTVTLNLQGSADGTNWYNVPYALVATPETVAVAAIVITTAVTTTYLLRPFHDWRFLKGALSANTNVTLTIDAYAAA